MTEERAAIVLGPWLQTEKKLMHVWIALSDSTWKKPHMTTCFAHFPGLILYQQKRWVKLGIIAALKREVLMQVAKWCVQ